MLKLLVIGGNGYFGSKLLNHKNFDIKIISRSKIINKRFIRLDITKQNIYNSIKHLNFNYIINLSTPKISEKRSNHIKINTIGINNVIEFSNKKKIPLIHFSSVAVYNTKKTNYDYGKYLAEKIINRELEKGIILRLPAIISEDYPNYKILQILKKFKFLLNFFPKKIKLHKINKPIHCYDVINILKLIIKKNIIKNKIKIYDLYGHDNTTLINFFNKTQNNLQKKNTIEKKLNYNIKSILDYL
jgi:dTDP-4-dehydrorhamnose reductase